ncbi:MAG: sigma-54-dependent Fis family transcriptional regulator [Planctomycetota bacterium]|nr:MAG: sigma-54-dependent Fis family transcriptional regulator [Planctomycetota bacterium]REK28475.1 MAG: sigma-54-dependent Fis family transcriptional regulator [Planctomycetota bacterium]REK29105.1 MAG: sigma-54-dependent Fis family transcriptional regulator [Planctomycetota bacterium]
MAVLLAIDDDRSILHMVQKSLSSDGLQVVTASSAEEGMTTLEECRPDVVILDVVLPGTSGLQMLEQIQAFDGRLPVIFITAGAGSETAIEAMRLGAYDYVAKPLDLPALKTLVASALETRRMMTVPVAVPIGDASPAEGELFIGRGPEMLDVFKSIGRVARQTVTVLVRGESGTGKELVARAIYQHSNRSDKPFMAVNCAALPDTLLESELFGHEKGAFTGADRRRIGKFEQCNGGTLFLDEVGDMSPLVQGKVLRLLQEQRFERVGGNETIETDVRLIAATNRNLEQMVEDNEFRADLFYRVNGVTIALPPLRKRKEDVVLLLQHFLAEASQELGKPGIEGLSPEAVEILTRYEWPGNVRELQSVVRQSVLKASGPVIVPNFLPPEILGDASEVHGSDDELPTSDLKPLVEARLRDGSTDLYAETLEVMERYLLTRVLQQTGGNQTQTAEILGITRGKVRDRIGAFGISLDKNVSIGGDEE